MDGIFNRSDGLIWLSLAVFILLVPIPVIERLFSKNNHSSNRSGEKNCEAPEEDDELDYSNKSVLIKNKGYIIDIFFLLFLTLLLIPVSVSDLAARIILDSHPISFIIGPALYFFTDGLVPGLDYHSHYSIGQGFIFSFMLGDNYIIAMENYVWMMVFTTWAFFGSSYLIISRFLESRKWAIGTCVVQYDLAFL